MWPFFPIFPLLFWGACGVYAARLIQPRPKGSNVVYVRMAHRGGRRKLLRA